MTLKQLQAIVEACLREPAEREGFPCERESEPEVRQALKDFIEATPYPGEEFHRLASDFYAEAGTIADQCDILDRWNTHQGRAMGEASGIPREVLEALAGHGTYEVERRATAEADGGGRGEETVNDCLRGVVSHRFVYSGYLQT